MDELGNILREGREAKGLTLAEVHEQLRINVKFLEALENGQYHQLPTPVHVRGYLRNYAQFLNLDPEPLLEGYERSKNKKPKTPVLESRPDIETSKPLPIRDDQPFFDPVNVDLFTGRGGEGSSGMRLVLIAALVIFIILIATRFVPRLLGREDNGFESITNAVTDLLSPAEATEAADDDSLPAAGETAAPANETSRGGQGGALETTDDGGADDGAADGAADNVVDVPLPTPTTTRPALPAVMERIELRLDIRERTFLQIVIDGEIQFQGQARAGELYEYEALQEVTVVAGNAIGVNVTINDIDLGRLGSRGEAITETWRTNSGG